MAPEHLTNQLFSALDKIIPLPLLLKEDLKALLKFQAVDARTFLFRENDLPDRVFFVCNGCFQENRYYPKISRAEPAWFWFANYFIFTTPGFFSQEPLQSDVFSIMESEVLYITIQDFEELKQKHPLAAKLSELIRDKDLRSRINHGFLISHFSAREIVQFFYKQRKILFRFAKRKDLAEFFGIDYNTLRRLLNDMM